MIKTTYDRKKEEPLMKKLLCALLAVLLLIPAFSLGEEQLPAFVWITGLDRAQELLDSGAFIDRVYYTDGYGFSISEFQTTDGEKIAQLWKAVNAITITGKSNEDITDWYPQIVFFFSDESQLNICFDAHWLEVGMNHYTLANDEAFWSLTAAMTAAYTAGDGEEESKKEDYYSFTAITVDGWEISPEELEQAMLCHLLQSAVNASSYGHEYGITDRDNIIDTLDKVLFDLELRAVIQHQAEQLGVDELTEEEYSRLWNETEASWQTLRGALYGENAMAFLPAGNYHWIDGDDEGNITRYLASFGVTEETLYAMLYDQTLEQKLLEAVTADMENAGEDEKISAYTDWILEKFWEADIHENGVGIAEVCFRLIP